MIEMQMGMHHIGNIIGFKTRYFQRFNQFTIPVQVMVFKKLFLLLCTLSGIDKYFAVVCNYQQAPHR